VRVNLHRALVDREFTGDLPVAQAARHAAHHIQLSCGEQSGEIVLALPALQQLFHGAGHRSVLRPLAAFVHRADALNQRAWRHVLGQHATHAQSRGFGHPRRAQLGGEQDHPSPEAAALERLQHRQPVHPRHSHVKHQDVGAMLLDGLQRRQSIRAAGKHLDVALAGQQRLQPAEHERVVVSQHQRDRHFSSPLQRSAGQPCCTETAARPHGMRRPCRGGSRNALSATARGRTRDRPLS